jgi:hypothetical protein
MTCSEQAKAIYVELQKIDTARARALIKLRPERLSKKENKERYLVEPPSLVCPPPVHNHAGRDIFRIAEGCSATRATVSTASSTGVPRTVDLVGAGTWMACGVIGTNALLDDSLPDLVVCLRLVRLQRKGWNDQHQCQNGQREAHQSYQGSPTIRPHKSCSR